MKMPVVEETLIQLLKLLQHKHMNIFANICLGNVSSAAIMISRLIIMSGEFSIRCKTQAYASGYDSDLYIKHAYFV